MHKMVTRNRGRKASIDIDNEELPVQQPVLIANDDLNADHTSSFLRAESKDAESDIDLDNDDIHDLDCDGEADDYVDVGTDSEDDDDFVDETRVCNDIVAMSSPYIWEMAEKGRSCVQYMYGASSLYLFWIMLHYFSTQMYVYYCAPRGFYGFFISPFLVAAPHCRAIRWIIHNGGNMVDNMWIILGTWLCSKIITGA
jgi:hypothetical protein